MIPRLIETQVFERMTTIHKTIILLGAHQVGKTTLFITMQSRLTQDGKSVRYLNCDLEEERQAIDAILINEVQRLDNPGLTLKTLVDLYRN
jgi:predicted AAA+ superfamily ATPase